MRLVPVCVKLACKTMRKGRNRPRNHPRKHALGELRVQQAGAIIFPYTYLSSGWVFLLMYCLFFSNILPSGVCMTLSASSVLLTLTRLYYCFICTIGMGVEVMRIVRYKCDKELP